MIITRQWLMDNRTENGAWTRAQLSVLGMSWPPSSGWIDELIGREISEDVARQFADARSVRGKQSRSHPVAELPPDSETVSTSAPTEVAIAKMVDTGPGATKLWFGKHKGKQLRDVPRDYLEWCLRERAGGGEILGDIAAVLGVEAPQKVVKYAGQSMTADELAKLKERPGLTPVQRIVDGHDIIAVANCEALFNPAHDWPGREAWDGITPPWK